MNQFAIIERDLRSGESVVAASRYRGRLRFFVKPDKDAVVLDGGYKEREVMVPRAMAAPASRVFS